MYADYQIVNIAVMGKMTRKCSDSPTCSVDYAFRRIGGKYKGRILWSLNEHKIIRFGELGRILADVTTKMLTQTLRELEKDDLIIRKVYPQVPPMVEYSLSETGLELIPFITHLKEWGDRKIQKKKSVETKLLI
ncbi:winged helix-turn-helix transcriptional regulator [Pedobacter sp. 22163]|uniref:winged helix-turn-helix transcriptional regulator n=1 Tax=Pedobacter sp. 22163 TaxID=3453883 RepID=UPI003F82ECA8